MIKLLKIFIMFGAFMIINDSFAEICSDGFEEITYISNSIFMPVNDGYDSLCKNSGYSVREIPSDIYPVFPGELVGDPISLCTNGQMIDGECVAYETGICNTDYVKMFVDSQFMPLNYGYDSLCQSSGFSVRQIPSDLYPVYSASLVGDPVTLCTNGYMSNGTCVEYVAGECPANYVDLALNDNIFTRLTNGVCASGYRSYTTSPLCDENTTDSMCAILCSDNLLYTDIGTCASICSGEYTTLRTSTGLIYPMYSEKQITPSINIGMGENVCYVNLLPGQSDGAINIQYDNKIYHTVK